MDALLRALRRRARGAAAAGAARRAAGAPPPRAGLVAVLASPLPALALTQRTRKYWFLGLPLPRRVNETGHLFLVGFRPPATSTAFAVAAAAVAVGLVLLAARADAAQRRGALVAAVVGGSAVGVPVALALAGADYVNGRNLIGALVPLLVVVAAGLGARRAGVVGAAATAAIVAVSFSVLDAAQEDRVAQRPGFRQVASVIGPAHGKRAILLEGSRTWARPLGLYLPRTWWMPRRGATVTEVDVVRRVPTAHDCPDATWWGAACDVAGRRGDDGSGPRAPGRRGVRHGRVRGAPLALRAPGAAGPAPREAQPPPAHARPPADRALGAVSDRRGPGARTGPRRARSRARRARA